MKPGVKIEYLPSENEPQPLNRDAHVTSLAQQLFDFMQSMEVGELQVEFVWEDKYLVRFSAMFERDDIEFEAAEAGAQRRPGS